MEEIFGKVKEWVDRIVEMGLLLVALGVVMQILFGSAVPFLGGDITGNLVKLVGSLGSNGVVGLIAIAIILHLFNRNAK